MTEQVEYVSCPICGSRDLEPVLRKDGWQLARCAPCQLGMINPRRKNPLAIYEADTYFSDAATYYDYAGNKTAYQKGFRSKLRLICEHQPKRGRLLDVGAAHGFFMEEANSFGFQSMGVELSPPAASHARKYGHVFQMPLESVDTDQRFSAVCFIDSLEHFERPLAALEKAWDLLEDDGVVAVMVPNIHSLFARLTGARWHLILPEEHLFYFTPKSIKLILKKAGFQLVHMGTSGYGRSAAEILHVLMGRRTLKMPTSMEGLLRKISFVINLGDLFVIARKTDSGKNLGMETAS